MIYIIAPSVNGFAIERALRKKGAGWAASVGIFFSINYWPRASPPLGFNGCLTSGLGSPDLPVGW